MAFQREDWQFGVNFGPRNLAASDKNLYRSHYIRFCGRFIPFVIQITSASPLRPSNSRKRLGLNMFHSSQVGNAKLSRDENPLCGVIMLTSTRSRGQISPSKNLSSEIWPGQHSRLTFETLSHVLSKRFGQDARFTRHSTVIIFAWQGDLTFKCFTEIPICWSWSKSSLVTDDSSITGGGSFYRSLFPWILKLMKLGRPEMAAQVDPGMIFKCTVFPMDVFSVARSGIKWIFIPFSSLNCTGGGRGCNSRKRKGWKSTAERSGAIMLAGPKGQTFNILKIWHQKSGNPGGHPLENLRSGIIALSHALHVG